MRYVAYYRVSTDGQGRSGLGLEGQRAAVLAHVSRVSGQMLAEFTEIESGKRDDRPKLAEAFAYAKATGATVIFARLDRLSRSAEFLLRLAGSRVQFMALDCPHLDTLNLGMRAIIAQHEREVISARTKAALAAAKARGTRLGNPRGFSPDVAAGGGLIGARANQDRADSDAKAFAPFVATIRAEGITTLSGIASAMNARHPRTPRGSQWSPMAVSRLLDRLATAA